MHTVEANIPVEAMLYYCRLNFLRHVCILVVPPVYGFACELPYRTCHCNCLSSFKYQRVILPFFPNEPAIAITVVAMQCFRCKREVILLSVQKRVSRHGDLSPPHVKTRPRTSASEGIPHLSHALANSLCFSLPTEQRPNKETTLLTSKIL